MESWVQGASFDEAMRQTDADEGEVVRYMRMAIQTLRQMIEGPVSPELKHRVITLIKDINRPNFWNHDCAA
jgi:superfamily II RNA helicase